MRRQIASFTLMVCGIIALVGGFSMLPAPAVVSAQSNQPSPRPTLQPTPDFRDTDRKPTAVIPGRLTGTIIDLRTGAPAPGVTVMVGNQMVHSDANGNYDIWLTSGLYVLYLELAGDQGQPGQPAQKVAVGPGDTVVVHLFFTSPAPPTATVEVVVPAPIVPTPTAAAPAVALPPSLPDTSVDDSAPAAPADDEASGATTSGATTSGATTSGAGAAGARPIADGMAAPTSLPNTAAGALGSPVSWLLFGALMLGLGAIIQLTPRRRVRAVRRPPPRPDAAPARRSADEDVLADLLDRDL